MTQVKEHNLPITGPKEMEICDLSEKELKIIVLRKFSETQVITER